MNIDQYEPDGLQPKDDIDHPPAYELVDNPSNTQDLQGLLDRLKITWDQEENDIKKKFHLLEEEVNMLYEAKRYHLDQELHQEMQRLAQQEEHSIAKFHKKCTERVEFLSLAFISTGWWNWFGSIL